MIKDYHVKKVLSALRIRNRIAIECTTRATRRTLTAAAAVAAAASGLILRSYGFMALDRGRWPPPPVPLPRELSELRRARELALALVECGTGKSRSARLRLVPMHSLLPLSPLRALSRPGHPSLSLSLSLPLLFALSRFVSLILFFSLLRSLTRIHRAHSAPLLYTRSTLHLIPLPSSFSIHVYI